MAFIHPFTSYTNSLKKEAIEIHTNPKPAFTHHKSQKIREKVLGYTVVLRRKGSCVLALNVINHKKSTISFLWHGIMRHEPVAFFNFQLQVVLEMT